MNKLNFVKLSELSIFALQIKLVCFGKSRCIWLARASVFIHIVKIHHVN